jgi:hypothetical protein
MHNVPKDDMTAATAPKTAPNGASANLGTVVWPLAAGLSWLIYDHSQLGFGAKHPFGCEPNGCLIDVIATLAAFIPIAQWCCTACAQRVEVSGQNNLSCLTCLLKPWRHDIWQPFNPSGLL